jgi:hypothetical protein
MFGQSSLVKFKCEIRIAIARAQSFNTNKNARKGCIKIENRLTGQLSGST